MSKLSVSLVMPNYNHETYLERSLGAALAQRIAADEIIVIDDASTDGSAACIARLLAGRSDVRLVQNASRSGVVAALNQGLAMATAELVAFPSADDVMLPDLIAELEPLLRANPDAAFACAVTEIRDEADRWLGLRPILWPTLSPRYVPPAEARRQLQHGDNFYLGPVTLYRRRALMAVGGFDPGVASMADGMVQRRLAVHHGYCFSPRVLGVWRHHTTNYSITSVTDPLYLRQLMTIAGRRITAEPVGTFPRDYARLLERRLTFNAARLVLVGGLSAAEKASRLRDMLALGPAAARLVHRLTDAGSPGAWLLLAWLTLSLRPFSLAWLAVEPLRRLLARGKGNAQR